MADELKDTWNIVVLQRVTMRTCFEAPLSREDAIAAFKAGDFEDIIDERDQEVEKVEDAE